VSGLVSGSAPGTRLKPTARLEGRQIAAKTRGTVKPTRGKAMSGVDQNRFLQIRPTTWVAKPTPTLPVTVVSFAEFASAAIGLGNDIW
jgi:hypothetical protein